MAAAVVMLASRIAVAARFSSYVPAAKCSCEPARRRSRMPVEDSRVAHASPALSILLNQVKGLSHLLTDPKAQMKREIKRVRFVVIAMLLFCGMAMQTRAAAAGLTSSGTLLALSQHDAPGRAQRTVTFEERVSYQ